MGKVIRLKDKKEITFKETHKVSFELEGYTPQYGRCAYCGGFEFYTILNDEDQAYITALECKKCKKLSPLEAGPGSKTS